MGNKTQTIDPNQNWNIALLSAVIIILIIILNYKFIFNGSEKQTINENSLILSNMQTENSFTL